MTDLEKLNQTTVDAFARVREAFLLVRPGRLRFSIGYWKAVEQVYVSDKMRRLRKKKQKALCGNPND